MTERAEDIVGHKTFSTGRMGPSGFPELQHEPLTRAEADELLQRSDHAKAQRAAAMPTESDAIVAMWSAWQRLKELGWRDAIYCPKDGTPFQAIEAGSAGIHECSYLGKWPTGSWLCHADGDLWPSRPILYRCNETVGVR